MSYDPPAYSQPISPKAPMWLTPEEKAAGISKELKVAAHRFLCPTCGKEFSLFQSRAVACKYCVKANQNCPNVRCPYCDTEYPLSGFIVPDKQDSTHMNQYADNVFNGFDDTYNRR
ncbi:MAG: hypothetical protein RBR05_02950 [Candidatus Methanomethylophilaceae archaeon]|nr:hypothetical protein [Candidatus Methanomethylophilaceae archaeon]MDD3379109.1 hypothetical protein [Candidatus Methanomethylophilaceae archaeon]MDY0224344.1 hypothetical protein [Candidatus Methanomethylophilaceae archaeon]